ncbi:MAG: 2-oxo acid dehydrogenase subunit E2 [Clostridia bacterium]|nr:2-oxo acid dehydrogenase subunit E2 [Clostridia bacterium]
MPPYTQITPYIMTRRCDAENNMRVEIDIDPIAEYIASLPPEAPRVSYMTLIIAAYVRALRKYPQVNRFIRGKKYYQRKDITVCFVVLKTRESDGSYEETVLKLKLDPDATLFEVCERVNKAVEDNREMAHENVTDKLLAWVLRAGPLVTLLVNAIKAMDYFGVVPKAVAEGSPFHTGLFITNLMSIRANYAYHHLYEFGTNSLFVSMGNCQRRLVLREGQATEKRYMPLGVTVDERICSGFEFICFFREFESYMRKPKRLETLD